MLFCTYKIKSVARVIDQAALNAFSGRLSSFGVWQKEQQTDGGSRVGSRNKLHSLVECRAWGEGRKELLSLATHWSLTAKSTCLHKVCFHPWKWEAAVNSNVPWSQRAPGDSHSQHCKSFISLTATMRGSSCISEKWIRASLGWGSYKLCFSWCYFWEGLGKYFTIHCRCWQCQQGQKQNIYSSCIGLWAQFLNSFQWSLFISMIG